MTIISFVYFIFIYPPQYFGFAQDLARKIAAPLGNHMINCFANRELYHAYRESILAKLGHPADFHKTSPMCFFVEINGDTYTPVEFIGGFDKFKAYVEEHCPVTEEPAPASHL